MSSQHCTNTLKRKQKSRSIDSSMSEVLERHCQSGPIKMVIFCKYAFCVYFLLRTLALRFRRSGGGWNCIGCVSRLHLLISFSSSNFYLNCKVLSSSQIIAHLAVENRAVITAYASIQSLWVMWYKRAETIFRCTEGRFRPDYERHFWWFAC